jgi:hypothetical protein
MMSRFNARYTSSAAVRLSVNRTRATGAIRKIVYKLYTKINAPMTDLVSLQPGHEEMVSLGCISSAGGRRQNTPQHVTDHHESCYQEQREEHEVAHWGTIWKLNCAVDGSR